MPDIVHIVELSPVAYSPVVATADEASGLGRRRVLAVREDIPRQLSPHPGQRGSLIILQRGGGNVAASPCLMTLVQGN